MSSSFTEFVTNLCGFFLEYLGWDRPEILHAVEFNLMFLALTAVVCWFLCRWIKTLQQRFLELCLVPKQYLTEKLSRPTSFPTQGYRDAAERNLQRGDPKAMEEALNEAVNNMHSWGDVSASQLLQDITTAMQECARAKTPCHRIPIEASLQVVLTYLEKCASTGRMASVLKTHYAEHSRTLKTSTKIFDRMRAQKVEKKTRSVCQ